MTTATTSCEEALNVSKVGTAKDGEPINMIFISAVRKGRDESCPHNLRRLGAQFIAPESFLSRGEHRLNRFVRALEMEIFHHFLHMRMSIDDLLVVASC